MAICGCIPINITMKRDFLRAVLGEFLSSDGYSAGGERIDADPVSTSGLSHL